VTVTACEDVMMEMTETGSKSPPLCTLTTQGWYRLGLAMM